MSSCLVLGGGLLGGSVATALANRGHDVTVFSRSYGAALDPVIGPKPDAPVRFVEGSIAHGPQLCELIDSAEVVFYFAGGSTPAGAEIGESVQLSVVPATAVLEAMRVTSTRRIVLASSGGTVYGDARSYPTSEDEPPAPIGIHGHNALTVESYARFFADHFSFEPVILRIATAYGPGQRTRRGQGVISAWINAVMDGAPVVVFGSPQTRRDFVYAPDVAEAAIRTGFDAPPAIYNVGSGTSVALEEVIGLLGELAGREIEVVQEPARGVDLPRTELDCRRLSSAIGWTPATPLAVGLRAMWEWTDALRRAAQDAGDRDG